MAKNTVTRLSSEEALAKYGNLVFTTSNRKESPKPSPPPESSTPQEEKGESVNPDDSTQATDKE